MSLKQMLYRSRFEICICVAAGLLLVGLIGAAIQAVTETNAIVRAREEEQWQKIYQDGVQAGQLGIDPKANPRAGRWDGQRWLDGWIEGSKSLKRRDGGR